MANTLRIIPLGGLGEVGKNMMAIEYGKNILIIDAGVMFPENDMLGIDLVIPDFGYLLDKTELVRGIILTHGHEDHTGALPYVLRKIKAPIYASRLTRGLVEVKLKRFGMRDVADITVVAAGERVVIGPFEVEFFQVNHSIPDGLGLAIRTPMGLVLHSGDFKFDRTPARDQPSDLARLAKYGDEGVLVLMADSTNAETPGFTPSEKVVEETLSEVFRDAPGRVIVATFASLISRIQQVVDCAEQHNRRIVVVGRSMIDNVRIAQDLGYLRVPPGLIIKPRDMDSFAPNELVVLATGSQGEPGSALSRMARGQMSGGRSVEIVPGDTVVISAHPIPGNEEMVHRIINRLLQKGANVLYSAIAQVHVSGHASREDYKLLLSLTRPQYFLPIHGELRHLHQHARIAKEMGMPAENIFIVENGMVIEFKDGVGRVGDRIPGGYVFVDGTGVGDIGPAVLRDRDALASDGFVVAVVHVNLKTGEFSETPEFISRGFVYHKVAESLMEEAALQVMEAVETSIKKEGPITKARAADLVRETLAELFDAQLKRHPMIVPVVAED